MVKRRFKRVLATVLIMAMVVGMSFTVFAEEGASNTNNSTATVSGNTVSGNTVEKEEPQEEQQPTETTNTDAADAAEKAAEEAMRIEEALPVASFISEVAIKAVPAEVKEASTEATGANVYNLNAIRTVKGFTAAVRKIAKANPNAESLVVFSNKPVTFSVETINTIQDSYKEFVYMFYYKGHMYKVTIPAGTEVELGGEKYAGPLYIGSLLGTSELVE